jgi:hypothetical protein
VKPIQIWWTVTHSAGFKFPSLVETGQRSIRGTARSLDAGSQLPRRSSFGRRSSLGH